MANKPKKLSMRLGCNAARVVATRIIHSPGEQLISIITSTFSLCNGMWPTQILTATIFIVGLVPYHWAGLASVGAVVSIAILGNVYSLLVPKGLSKSILSSQISS
ncbi:hypothetical protein [Maribacter confluentis]